jgi:hypothetical protein
MGWPKVVTIRGVEVSCDSWDEVGEVVTRFGGTTQTMMVTPRPSQSVSFSNTDLDLLTRLVEAGVEGLPRRVVGAALSAKGRWIEAAMQTWAQRLGLIADSTGWAYFESIRDAKGRRVRITPQYLENAIGVLVGL